MSTLKPQPNRNLHDKPITNFASSSGPFLNDNKGKVNENEHGHNETGQKAEQKQLQVQTVNDLIPDNLHTIPNQPSISTINQINQIYPKQSKINFEPITSKSGVKQVKQVRGKQIENKNKNESSQSQKIIRNKNNTKIKQPIHVKELETFPSLKLTSRDKIQDWRHADVRGLHHNSDSKKRLLRKRRATGESQENLKDLYVCGKFSERNIRQLFVFQCLSILALGKQLPDRFYCYFINSDQSHSKMIQTNRKCHTESFSGISTSIFAQKCS